MPMTAPMPLAPAPVPPKKPSVWRSKPLIVAYVVVGLLLVLGMVFLPDEPEPDAAPPPVASKAAPSPASRCEPVSKEFGQAILDGGDGLKFLSGAAVKGDSGDYFVALKFSDGGDPMVGVWQAKNLKGGPFGSVDGFAQQFTNWPDTKNNGAAVVDEVKACLS